MKRPTPHYDALTLDEREAFDMTTRIAASDLDPPNPERIGMAAFESTDVPRREHHLFCMTAGVAFVVLAHLRATGKLPPLETP